MPLVFHHVSFAYDGSPLDVVADLSAHFPVGWTGVVGANGVGKSTVLQLAVGLLEPTDGSVQDGRAALYCAQRTDDAPAHLQELALDYSAEASVLRQRLGIGDGWAGRWHSLSHGERKRCQIATALWQRPDVLAIDEPMTASPISRITVRTSAKSTLMRPGTVMSSEIPRVAP